MVKSGALKVGEGHFFVLTITENTFVEVLVRVGEGSVLDPHLELGDSDGYLIESDIQEGAQLPPGEYQLNIMGARDTSGSYKLGFRGNNLMISSSIVN